MLLPWNSKSIHTLRFTVTTPITIDLNFFTLMLCSGDEDQAQERINKLAKILKEHGVASSLRTAGVGVISCIIQRDEGRAPMRHSFHWTAEKSYYEEEPLLRHLEPPLSIYLELVSCTRRKCFYLDG